MESTSVIFRSRLANIHEFACRGGFSSSEISILDRESAEIAADEKLSALFGAHLQAVCQAPDFYTPFLKNKPWNSPLFDLIFLLASCCDVRAMYERKGWTDEMFGGVLRDIKLWADHCLVNEHTFGISRGLCSEISWITAQCMGQVLRFGRLQCNSESAFPDERMILGSRKDGSWIVVMRKEYDLNAQGLIALEGEPVAAHCLPMEENSTRFRGCTVRRDGSIDPVFRDFPKNEWEILVKPGDFSINLHIPADGPLAPEECRESFRRMIDFFRKEGKDPKAFICHSWILDPQFARILPENSNLTAFQKLGQISTSPGGSEAYRRVFGFNLKPENAHLLPHPTKMQQAFIRFIREGGSFRSGSLSLPIR